MISDKPAREIIQQLNATDETEDIEVKLGAGRSALETICSLSNEPDLGGGTILLGVRKETDVLFPLFEVAGVKDVDKVVTDLSSQCASVFNFPVRVDISQEIVDSRCVLRVDVPELPSTQKPLYFKAQGLPGGAFRRIGSTDVHCTHDDLYAFYQTRAQDPPDRHTVDDASWEDIDPLAIETYRRARAEVNPLAEELNWQDSELVHSLNGLVKQGNDIRITITGLTMFGKAPALRRIVPSHRVDYIRVPSKTWVRELDSSFDSVGMRGAALRTIGRIMAAILDDLPRAFHFEAGEAQRTDLPLIPERVIREAVVNAIMHRNYQVFSPIQIIRYSNRLEIRNPGYSLKSQERLNEPGSTLRNPHIAEILHETRFAETKGSGIRVMRQKMTEMGLAEPTFISSREDDSFHAIFLFHHFLNEEDWKWLSLFNGYSLDNEQMRSLIFLREMGAIDNATYRNLYQVDTLAASISLRRLREHGLLDAKGSSSRTYYVPSQRFNELAGQVSMHANAVDMHARRATERVTLYPPALPDGLAARIAMLGKRVDPEVTERLIEAICTWQPTSADDIASYLGRTKNYVSNKYIYRMVREGRLQYMYPEMVKHPGQKLKTPPRDEG